MRLPEFGGVLTRDELDPYYISQHYACSLVNFGNLYEMSGNPARAEAIYRRAAAWAPGYRPAVEALRSLQKDVRTPGKSAAVTGGHGGAPNAGSPI